MWTILNFKGTGKTNKKKKAAHDICERTLDIDFERDRSIGLASTFDDGQTDRHTHTHRPKHTHGHFLKHVFRLWEWYRIENHTKWKSNFVMTAILPSLLLPLESNNV